MHKLFWSFGVPQQDKGELICDFYYQTGRHAELRLPWPSQRFAGSGELTIALNNGLQRPWGLDFSSGTVEAGKKLYLFLGKEAQTSLIRAFTNLPVDTEERILTLQFASATGENRERCLALEDLPWELLHDGEKFITERYNLQIVRSYTHDLFINQGQETAISSWGILLVSPFVFSPEEQTRAVGLTPLPMGQEEIQTIRNLEKRTFGLVHAGPPEDGRSGTGITHFAELEKILFSKGGPQYHMIHFVGHGLIYDEEPCLCFESETGGVDYVSVDRMRKLFLAARQAGIKEVPPVLFLNACSSSSRGRYSAGFAAALHDLGICVLGYKTEIRDDTIPIFAARSFYQSLCVDQSLETPYQSTNVITAVGAARRALRKEGSENKPLWGSFRAYVPTDLSFRVLGRGLLEKTVQHIYRFFAQSMTPSDYTEHLALSFVFALLFGTLMGIANLTFIFPEAVSSTYLTYLEILSELARIFMIGPLTFLAASLLIAWQTQKNHLFLLPWAGQVPKGKLLLYHVKTLPIEVGAGFCFALLLGYFFSSLDLLTNQTVSFTQLPALSIQSFWNGFQVIPFTAMTGSLILSNWLYLLRRESLHSYRTYHVTLIILGLVCFGYVILMKADSQTPSYLRFAVWELCTFLITISFGLTLTKTIKEISWSASQKRKIKTGLSWKKLIPLLGGASLGLLFYFFLEESVRFDPNTIHTAILERKQELAQSGQDNLQVIRVLERALKQRAISEIPESTRDVASEDWLLSVICADYSLYKATQETDSQEFAAYLNEAKAYLDTAKSLTAEVQFKDYYCNIAAMVNIFSANAAPTDQERLRLLNEALTHANLAITKDNNNFAYLDTLARAEAKLAVLNQDLSLLKQAAGHIRRAQWSAFFLRSDRAREVQDSVAQMADYIQEQIKAMEQAQAGIPLR
ncbi:MAG: CHAT domain-containing protein [bacterium]|nr:CHAT domain-containing protein [bacterium]